MCQDVTNLRPLFLSEEETMALLDLCLTSTSETDDAKDRAIRKLTELARCHLRANVPEERCTPASESGAARGNSSARPSMKMQMIDETLRIDAVAFAPERLTPITMMARSMAYSHAPRRQMGTALRESHIRIRKTA